jgi:large subunit ribosomal protein L15
MVLNHRKKNSRHRGSWTHGYGEKKKHRGAGSRGGRGNAGSGKRGDAKKPSYWKIKNFVGKHGFTNPRPNKVVAITISQLNTNIGRIVALGKAIESNGVYKINLSDVGAHKLLGTGSPKYSFEIVAKASTKGAIEKIKAKGGSVLIEAPSFDSNSSSESDSIESKSDSSEE